MNEPNQETLFTLIYDGQCVICRGLVDRLIRPFQPKTLEVKSSQEVSLEDGVSEAVLARAKTEILLRDETEHTFVGGIPAVTKTLELLQKHSWARKILEFKPFEPLYSFGYYLFAFNRYSWIPIPGYLRCAECEITIPPIWNIAFFVLIGLLSALVSFTNLYIWMSWFELKAETLFNTVNDWPLSLITGFSLLLAGAIQLITSALAFTVYRKSPGVNRIEVVKQYYISSLAAGLIAITLNSLLVAITLNGWLDRSLTLTLLTIVLLASIALSGIWIHQRWAEISFGGWRVVTLLILDHLLRQFSPFVILYIAQ